MNLLLKILYWEDDPPPPYSKNEILQWNISTSYLCFYFKNAPFSSIAKMDDWKKKKILKLYLSTFVGGNLKISKITMPKLEFVCLYFWSMEKLCNFANTVVRVEGKDLWQTSVRHFISHLLRNESINLNKEAWECVF